MRLGYYHGGFLAIQRAVDVQIMYELGGTAAEQQLNITDVRLKSFPYPPYDDDMFITSLEGIMGLAMNIMISFIITVPIICRDVVLEKERNLKVGCSRDSKFVNHDPCDPSESDP